MKPKQAIEVMFREWKCIDRNDGVHCDRQCEKCDLVMEVSELRDAFNLAISALEKQIPKKPKSVFCPQCGEEFTDDDCWSSDYCRNCGQAIDWEE